MFFLILIFIILLFIVVSYLIRFKDRKNTTKSRFNYPLFLVNIIAKIFTVKIEVKGRENIPQDPYLIISNHQSNADIAIYMLTFKHVAFVAKKSMQKIPFVAGYMNILGCYFLDRDSISDALLIYKNIAKDMKNKQQSFVLYPEGTRSKKDEMLEFKDGAFILPRLAKCTILPVTIKNSHKVKFLKRTTVQIIIHPPILFEDHKVIKADALSIKVKEIIQGGLQ